MSEVIPKIVYMVLCSISFFKASKFEIFITVTKKNIMQVFSTQIPVQNIRPDCLSLSVGWPFQMTQDFQGHMILKHFQPLRL